MDSSAFQHKPCPCSDTDNVADNVKSDNTEKHLAHQTPCQWKKKKKKMVYSTQKFPNAQAGIYLYKPFCTRF